MENGLMDEVFIEGIADRKILSFVIGVGEFFGLLFSYYQKYLKYTIEVGREISVDRHGL